MPLMEHFQPWPGFSPQENTDADKRIQQGCTMPERRLLSSNREAAIAESWQRTLGAIPTLIGRLAYLSSLRNANTGSYEHFGLAQRIGEDEVDRTLRRSHMNTF